MFLPQSIFSRVQHVGISISPYVARVVVIDAAGKITNQAEEKADQLIFSGDKVNVPKLSEILKALKLKIGLDEIYAACCFPEKFAYSHEHILPPLNNSEVTEAIHWQLDSIFPLKSEDLYTDWKLIEKTEKELRVVITAVSRQFLDGLVESFQNAAIKPLSFESSTSALARSLKAVPENALIIELDNIGSSITLVEHGVSSLTATTNFASSTDSQAVLTEIVTTINQLKNRIPQNPEKPIETPIYITGEKAVPELVDIISKQVGQPLQNLSADNVSNSFQCAYLESLSTVEAPESTTSINLLPQSLEQQYRLETELAQTKTASKYGISFSLITLLLSIVLFVVSSIFTSTSAKKLLSASEPPLPPEQINLPLLLQKSQKITQFQSYEYVPIQHFDTVLSIIPSGIIRQLNYDASKKTIQITLSGINRTELFTLKTTLDETKLFNQISIPLSALNSDETDSVILNLSIQVKP